MIPTRASLVLTRSSRVFRSVVSLMRSGGLADAEASQRGQPVHELGRGGDALEVGVDHHLDEAGEVDEWLPPELRPCFRAVADEVLHFGRPDQLRIELDVLLPVE